MLPSGYNPNSRENFLKIKMEEQTVPSAGFSPQPEYMSADFGSSNYYGVSQHNGHQQHHQAQQMHGSSMNGCSDYPNFTDSFDLSLLEDTCDDKDMATVPSPSSMEPNMWNVWSLYAASPPEYRAFSPDCSPAKPFVEMNGQQVASRESTASLGSATPPPPILNGLPYQAPAVDVNNSLSTDDVTNNCSRTNTLIRQCLEDNTFIEKYNFKPLDLPITSFPHDAENSMDNAVPTGATAVGSPLEFNQIEPAFKLACEQIIADMQNTCRTLAISPDPSQWSVADVQSWLSYTHASILGNNSSPAAANVRALWNVDGGRLCSMSEEDFRRRDPINGEKFFANLELLKMAPWKSADIQQAPQTQSQASPQIIPSGQMGSQPTFDLGQILLSSVASVGGPYSLGSPASCSGSSTLDQSPSPASFEDMKIELEDSLTPASNAKFSNPSSVETSSMRNSDDDDEDEEEDEKPVGKAKACGTKNGAHIHLWQFLKELLASGQQHGSCIRWLDQPRGVFKIEDSVRVARLWGNRKNRPAMNYDKLSRSIRQYYKKRIMKKTERSQRLVYQFCHPYGL